MRNQGTAAGVPGEQTYAFSTPYEKTSPSKPPRSPQHHPPAPRRNRATSWWKMTLLGAGLLGAWVVMGVGYGVFLGLLAGLWFWAGCIDKNGGY